MAKPTGNKVKGGKAKKQRATEHKKRKAEASGGAAAAAGGDDGGKDIGVGAAPSGNQRNPKAFIFSGQGKAKRQAARTAEKDQRRMHVPVMDRASDEPPPFTVLVHGPPGVGKSTLIRNLVKHYTRHSLSEIKGPITVVSGKTRRLTFVECPQDLNAMLDASKYADLVLLLIDGSFGFEMETFEFLNLLQTHGFPKVMGVLTHLDGFKEVEKLKKVKKSLKHRFWTEIYQGAKLFYLSGMRNGKYLKREVLNLARFISVTKFRPLVWRTAHPYLVADRFEDITPPERVRRDPTCDREVAVYGYLRGCNMKQGARVHLAGVGDYTAQDLAELPDPCPLPSSVKRRGLNDKDRLIYAPMADVGGLLYDKDAMYIDIPDWKVQFTGEDGVSGTLGEGEEMVRGLQGAQEGVDEKLQRSQIQFFQGGAQLRGDVELQEDGTSDDEAEDEVEGGSDDEDGSSDEDKQALPSGMPTARSAQAAGGRVRRRAVFGQQALEGHSSSDESEGDEEEAAMPGTLSGSAVHSKGVNADDSDGSGDSEGLGAAAAWKGNLLAHAAEVFSCRGVDLQSHVYAQRAVAERIASNGGATTSRGQGAGGDSSDDELFAPRTASAGGAAGGEAQDAFDCSRFAADGVLLASWAKEGSVEGLRNRFVTGDWAAAERRATAVPGVDDGDDADELFGDFEDLEAGVKISAGDDVTAMALHAIKSAGKEDMKDRLAEKAAKKAAFDAEYDVGGSKAVKDDPVAASKPGKKAAGGDTEGTEETYYDVIKKDMGGRVARTKAAMDALDPALRVAMEGFRPGSYLRMRFTGMPCELVQHFDAGVPLLVGGVLPAEEGSAHLQLRLKRHRWFPKTLKTRDPLVFSIGWRRFQSIPVYALEDPNGRQRMLKYTPEHMHCLAVVWGASAPPNTGVLAIQKTGAGQSGWRISATGVVLNLDASLSVMKKIKLVGTPFKIAKHTAFVGGMFNSALEVSKFEGASIRTVSGIRGTIKKALRAGVQGGVDGSFRASFEDKPLMSDTVFLRAWVAVDLPRFYNPVTNLLAPKPAQPPVYRHHKREEGEEYNEVEEPVVYDALPAAVAAPAAASQQPSGQHVAAAGGPAFLAASAFKGAKTGYVFGSSAQGTGYYMDEVPLAARAPALSGAAAAALERRKTAEPGLSAAEAEEGAWAGMRTVAELRRALGVGAPRNSDSLYRPIERAPRKFNPLKIPRALQAELPFKSKPRIQAPRKRQTLEQKRAVVMEPGERKAVTLYAQLNAIRNQKAVKRRDQQTRRRGELVKKTKLTEAWRDEKKKDERKKRFLEAGMAEKRQAKKMKHQ